MVSLDNVYKSFSGKEVLRGIALDIKKGELLTLLGPSGAGKSTLMRIINLFENPSKGRLYFEGKEISGHKGGGLLKVRRKMTMVTQKPAMLSGNVFHNVAYGLKVRGYPKARISDSVEEALETVGLEGYSERDVSTLSGGEAQRVAFARAIVVEPELLLLDEPTTSLDPESEANVHRIIERIKGEQGMAMVLTTHKQREALALGDRIAVLHRGKLQQVGTPREVIYSPRTKFVARFTGMENTYQAWVEKAGQENSTVRVGDARVRMPWGGLSLGEQICIGIRPEDVMLLRTDIPINPRHENVYEGRVEGISPQGSAMLRLKLSWGNLTVKADIPRHAAEKMGLRENKKVLFSFKSTCVRQLEHSG